MQQTEKVQKKFKNKKKKKNFEAQIDLFTERIFT